ncbi:NlpC/P60 family protein [Streptomyces sp. H10-C2]|uniref:C40 family peptidase n=1 Tax=unclassified Streptomyces TaxID=2593676 RepID=UPI0024B94E8A|nr:MULTISPECIES: NlpC/P60 family protein [unclassified Streptomyces]MDJ0341139.1 NlpC/P60 family protein [Streptomyces sp. PH10-H1]MDJ0369509.1 NlpC/P60 family protein [Streptomyces sp. H10-C2]
MASHRRPKPTSRTRVTVLTATAAAAVALSSQAAHAAPAKPDIKDVKSQVDALYSEAEQATEKYNGAKEQQGKLQKEVGDLQDRVAREQAGLNNLREGLGAMASAQYRTGGIDPTLQLFLSADPDSYLSKASTMDQVTSQQADSLKQIQDAKRTLDQQRTEATTKMSELEGARTELGKQKDAAQSKLAAAQKLLNSLTAQQRAALADQEARANRSNERPNLGSSVAPSERAAAALAAAKTKIGKPYVYGATGPNSYDCSGLTSWAYAQAGVSIPRTSEEQANAGTHLSMSQLAPGDLVIFFGDAHHVGFYAGNGMVLHAPKPGAYVRYEAMSDMPFQFGVRI